MTVATSGGREVVVGLVRAVGVTALAVWEEQEALLAFLTNVGLIVAAQTLGIANLALVGVPVVVPTFQTGYARVLAVLRNQSVVVRACRLLAVELEQRQPWVGVSVEKLAVCIRVGERLVIPLPSSGH